MQTSHFQLGLIATLALGLGLSLSSASAIGYPAGAAVSMGSNPVWNAGGSALSDTVMVMAAPADQDLVVTDVVLTFACMYCSPRTQLVVGEGTTVASFRYHQTKDYYDDSMQSPHPVQHSFRSGLRVPAGETLYITAEDEVDFTISGYHAQP